MYSRTINDAVSSSGETNPERALPAAYPVSPLLHFRPTCQQQRFVHVRPDAVHRYLRGIRELLEANTWL